MKLAEALPEGFEQRESVIKQFGDDADVATLAKSWVELRTKMSNGIRAPGKESKPEEWSEFWDKLGRPPSPEGYDLPADLPKQLTPLVEAMREAAHAKGVTRDQMSSMISKAAEKAGASAQQVKQLRGEWERRFREANGDKADARLADARETLDKLVAGDPSIKEALEASGLESHPAILDAILKVRTAMSDDKSPFGGSPGTPAGPSPSELYDKGLEIMASEEYKKASHPLHAIAARNLRQIQANLMAAGYSGLNDPKLIPRPTFTLPTGEVIR